MAFIGISVPPSVGDLLEQITVPGNLESKSRYHVTLVNLGKDIPIEEIGRAAIVAFGVCTATQPFPMTSKLVTSFPAGSDGVPIIAKIESPGLHKFHAAMTAALDSAGVKFSKKFPEFKPHCTLAYSDAGTDMPDQPIVPPVTWTASEIVLWGGDSGERRIVVKFPLELKNGSGIVASMGRRHQSLQALRVAARYQVACGDKKCSTCTGDCKCQAAQGERPELGPHDATSKQAARWDNSVNGTYFSLYWNKSKWLIYEMADGSPIPAMSSFGGEKNPNLVSYEMPQLEALLKKYDTMVNAHPDSIRGRAHILDDKGPIVREKISIASTGHLKQVIEERKAEGSDASDVERILREIGHKFVWKKVR